MSALGNGSSDPRWAQPRIAEHDLADAPIGEDRNSWEEPVGIWGGKTGQELYVEHSPAARQLASSMVPEDVVETIVDAAFAKVLAVIRMGGGPSHAFQGYLLTAVHNTAVEWQEARYLDAAVHDALVPDAAVSDAVIPDAPVHDAAVPDAAVPDAAVPDAVILDAAVPDAAAQAVEASRALSRGGIALLANSGLTAIFGVLFWLIAARVLSATAVGRGSALVAALLTVSGLCQVNYARSLSGLLPSAIRPKKLLATVYGLTAALSFAVGLAAALILPRATAAFSYLRGDTFFVVLFAVSVVLWTVFNLEDSALTSVRRAIIIPFENGTYGVLKLVCLVGLWWAGYRTSEALFVAWVLPLVAVIVPVNLYLFLRALRAAAPAPVQRERLATPWLRYDLIGYLLWLAGTLPLPVLVVASVGPDKAADFYVPFTIATSIDLLSLMLGNSLTAEISRARGVMTSATRSYVRRVWIMVGVLSVCLCVLAPFVLQAFGDRYRAGGTLILQVFMIATLPRSVLFLGIAVLRARGEGKRILLLQAVAALGTLALGFVFIRSLGAVGMAFSWLLASCLAASVAAIILASNAVSGRHRRGRTTSPGGVIMLSGAGKSQ